jgi:hypothetical protein
MVFSKVICKVGFPQPPVYSELILSLTILEPMKMHIHCFCSFGLDSVVDYPFCHRVVCLDWCFWLWVAHFGKYLLDIYCFFALRYNAPNSASATDDITAFIMVATVRIAPLLGGNSSSFDRKKCPPARLRDFFSFQYPASLWTASIILLAE